MFKLFTSTENIRLIKDCPKWQKLFMIETSKNLVLYPGCGIDLTPLLIGLTRPFPKDLSQATAIKHPMSDYLFIDKSRTAIKFFENLKPEQVVFDRSKSFLLGNRAYITGWLDSELDLMTIKQVDQYDLKGQNNIKVRRLIVESDINGKKISKQLFFIASESSALGDILKSLPVLGLFSLKMNSVVDLIGKEIWEKIDYIVSDSPLYQIPDNFSFTNTYYNEIKNRRHLSTIEGALLYINKRLFDKSDPLLDQGVWIIPNRFFATTEQVGNEHTDFVIVEKSERIEKKNEIRDVVSRILSALKARKPLVLTCANPKVLRLVIGCFLIESFLAQGEEVFESLKRLSEFNNNRIDLETNSKKEDQILKEWNKK